MTAVVLFEALGAVVAAIAFAFAVSPKMKGVLRQTTTQASVGMLLSTSLVLHIAEVVEHVSALQLEWIGETLGSLMAPLWMLSLLSLAGDGLRASLKTEAALRQHVFHAAGVAMAVLDDKGALLEENDEWRALFKDDTHPDIHRLAVEKGNAAVPHDDRWLNFDVVAVQLRDDEPGHLVLAHDVTEELNRAKEDVLQERALQHANRLELAGMLASGVAHDVRNALFVVREEARFALPSPPSTPPNESELLESAGVIEEGLAQATSLLNSLTAMAKTTSSRSHCDLRATLSSAKRLLSRALPPQQHLVMLLDGDVAEAQVSFGALEVQQMLLNLLLNASDAMDDGDTVSISLSRHDDVSVDGEKCAGFAIDVEDEGSGMDEDTLAQAFTPLFTTKANLGTGLGLAMVRSMVENGGGQVTVTSALDEGTCVRLWFPSREAVSPNPSFVDDTDNDGPEGTQNNKSDGPHPPEAQVIH